jgi:hypothetical protein
MQPQDRVKTVQGAAEIGDVRLVGYPVADDRDEPAEAGDLVGEAADLSQGPGLTPLVTAAIGDVARAVLTDIRDAGPPT